MPISIAGSGTITGISAGGLPDDCITTAEIAANAVTTAKLGTNEASGLCKAWVNFNGTGTVAIRASYNVSSITDHGTGDYTVNFTTAMVDANYCGHATTSNEGSSNRLFANQNVSPMLTSGWRVACWNAAGSTVDANFIHISIFR